MNFLSEKLQMYIKQGSVLTDNEFEQINKTLDREFTVASSPREFLRNRLFFLLKNNEDIISFCSLVDVKPVYLNKEEFSLKGIVHVVSNEKGKGYGKMVIHAMMDYLQSNGFTAIGFTHIENKGFYEKCGCVFPQVSTQRFITKEGETNKDGQIVFCVEGRDSFLKKVLSNQNENIILPKTNLW